MIQKIRITLQPDHHRYHTRLEPPVNANPDPTRGANTPCPIKDVAQPFAKHAVRQSTTTLADILPPASPSSFPELYAQGYVPGLGEMMSGFQMRHAKLWYAGTLDELREGFEDAAKYHPTFKGKPISTIIGPMTAQPMAQT